MKSIISKSLFSVLVVSISLTSCKPEGCMDPLANNYDEKAKKEDGSCAYDDNFKLNMTATFNGEPLELNKDYINISNYRLRFTDVKVIMTNIKTTDNMLSDAAVFNIKKGNSIYSGKLNPGNYSGLSFYIGVDGDRNNSDPTQYETGHPLNINEIGDMHWSWNTGYIFYKIEGRYDLDPNSTGTPSELFLYHIGMNQYRKLWERPSYSFEVKNGSVTNVNLELDLAKIFYSDTDTIDMEFEDFTHTGPNEEALNIKLSEIFPHAISLKE